MTTVMIHHRVADYDKWKIEYDRIFDSPLSAAVQSYRIWRGQDDPGLVILEETYESREAAEGALNNPDLLPELVTAGVEMSSVRIDYVDELESGSH
jgi:hypothetical protein